MKKVVIVEDDQDLLETLSLFLEDEGFKVWKFEKSRPVYKKVKKLNPDSMVVDLMLPDINGDKLAAYIKEDHELKNTKVILISADESVARTAKESGADAYLKKPFSFDKLLTLVN